MAVRLLAKGLGLDPARWETYRVAHAADARGDSYAILPYASILAFDLAKLPYRAVDLAEAERDWSRPAPTGKDAVLLDALYRGDWHAIKDNLDGANPRARDEWGRTPLMLAARAANRPAVIELGDLGADVRDRDPEGFTAWDYCTLPVNVVNSEAAGTMYAVRDLEKAAGL